MVTVYKLNGISVYKRYREEFKDFEFRLFEDDPDGYMMRFPEDKSLGNMLDGVWNHIQERVGKRLHTVQTEVIVK